MVSLDRSSVLRRTLTLLVAVEILLVLLDFALNRLNPVPYRPFRRLFNIAYDNSIGGWFSSALCLVSSLLAAGVAFLRRREGQRRASLGWLAVAAFFLYLSADDAAKIHERIGSTFDGIASSGHLQVLARYPSYTWQVTVGPLLAGAGIFVAFFLWRELYGPTGRALLLLALGCLATAVFLDVAEGTKSAYQWVARHTWLGPFSVSHYFRVVEEFLEMLGMTLFLAAFLDFLLRRLHGLTFLTGPGGSPAGKT